MQPRQVGRNESVLSLMPKYEVIPDRFKGFNSKSWGRQIFTEWFFKGIADSKLNPKKGIDKEIAILYLYNIICSFEPKHEHKEAAAAFLIEEWFEQP
jgi:hypothetical protein